MLIKNNYFIKYILVNVQCKYFFIFFNYFFRTKKQSKQLSKPSSIPFPPYEILYLLNYFHEVYGINRLYFISVILFDKFTAVFTG